MRNVSLAVLAAAFVFGSFGYTKIQKNSEVYPLNKKEINLSQNTIPFNNQIKLDLSEGWAIMNGCLGNGNATDIVSGTFHIVIHGIIGEKRLSYTYHSNMQNVVLLDPNGTQYVGNHVANISESLKFDGTYTYKRLESYVLATPSRRNNGVIKYDLMLSIDPNGVVDVKVDNFREECQ